MACSTSARNLFGLLKAAHNFATASYKRVLEWEKLVDTLKGRKKLIRFENFGKTRWYSYERSISKIFGSYDEPSVDVFLVLLEFLYNVKSSSSFEPKVSFEASALLDNWTKLETIVTVFTFLEVFEILGPVSKYFKTKGCDLMAAVTMSKTATEDIRKCRDSFEELKPKSIDFAKTVNNNISDEMNFFVSENLEPKRVRQIRSLPGEKAKHEAIHDEWKNFRVNEFLVIIDTTTQTLTSRFSSAQNEEVVCEMSLFLPTKFKDLLNEKINLPFLSRVLKVESNVLIEELKHFSKHFASLLKVDTTYDMIETLVLSDIDEEVDDSDEESATRCSITKKPCNKCLKCCFLLLSKLNLHISTYSNLYRAYEYFITLPCTQVECERTFSKLRILKSRTKLFNHSVVPQPN